MDDPTKLPSESDQSMDNKTDAKSTTKDIHDERHGDNAITNNYTEQPETSHNSGTPQTGIKEIPETPQQNPVQSTSTHRHNSDQHTPIPMSEHRTVHTHGQGLNPTRPLKDESTQMPSQEVLMITSNQGTQFPSQQWEQTPNSKDQEETQHKTRTPERAVTHTSCQRTGVSETYPSSPTEPSLAKTHTADAVESHTLEDSRPTGTRDNITPETNQTRESNNPRTVEPKHPRNDDSESDSTTDPNVPNEDHTTSIHIAKCAQPESIGTEETPNSNQITGEQYTHRSRHITQVDHGFTTLGDTEHPTSIHTEITEPHKTGNTIIETTSGKNTPHQCPYSGQDTPGTEGPGGSMGIPSPITKVASDINSEITPIVITISENSSDDDAQVSTVPSQKNRPDQNPQEITLNSSEDESSDKSRDTVTISSEDSADGDDAETQPQNQQRDRQDQEVTILEHSSPGYNTKKHRTTASNEIGTTNPRHPSTPQRREKTHQRGQSAYIGPDHNNNISIQRRRRTSHHISQDKPATTRNSCDGTLHRLIPIGKSDRDESV